MRLLVLAVVKRKVAAAVHLPGGEADLARDRHRQLDADLHLEALRDDALQSREAARLKQWEEALKQLSVVTGLPEVLFPERANGSIIVHHTLDQQ